MHSELTETSVHRLQRRSLPGYRCRAWKRQLQSQLADSHGLTIAIAHYPTGASNPTEHRLFSEISKNWAGEPLDSYQKILHLLSIE